MSEYRPISDDPERRPVPDPDHFTWRGDRSYACLTCGAAVFDYDCAFHFAWHRKSESGTEEGVNHFYSPPTIAESGTEEQ